MSRFQNIHRRRMAQSGIELIFLSALLFLTVTAGYLAFMDKNAHVAEQQTSIDARKVSGTISFEINNAFSQGDGFSKNFTLPSTINGNNYNITISDGFVIVDAKENSFISKIIVSSITGTIVKAKNTVSNTGGIINVNAA